MNNLKKGVLILVAVMFLVIPNLNVYSSIGSYQNASLAIVANKSNCISIGKCTCGNGVVSFQLPCSVEVTEQLIQDTLDYIHSRMQGDSKQHNPIAENYDKHDFTGFDN